MIKKYIMIISCLFVATTSASCDDRKPSRMEIDIETHPRWPVVLELRINDGRSWNGGGGIVGLNYPEGSDALHFDIKWAEIHTGRAFALAKSIPVKEFQPSAIGQDGVDVYVRVGKDGEVFIGSDIFDFSSNELIVTEVLLTCAERTPSTDGQFVEEIEWEMLNFGNDINSWLNHPQPESICPSYED